MSGRNFFMPDDGVTWTAVAPDNPMPVKASSGDNPVAGQLSAGSTAQALGDAACIAVLVQNDPANTENVLLGDDSAQTFVLQPGQAVSVPCSNIGKVYARMASGTGAVNWLAVS